LESVDLAGISRDLAEMSRGRRRDLTGINAVAAKQWTMSAWLRGSETFKLRPLSVTMDQVDMVYCFTSADSHSVHRVTMDQP